MPRQKESAEITQQPCIFNVIIVMHMLKFQIIVQVSN